MSRRSVVSPFLLVLMVAPVAANPLRDRPLLRQTEKKLRGQMLDYTRNHGSDNRIWSPALCEKRDLYVYLPPCYNPEKRYPLIMWLHGFAQDEVSFLRYVAVPIDEAISCGRLPPVIIACPDGSLHGRAHYWDVGSFFVDSKAGDFEKYVMEDVWNFVHERFSIRPEREAHVLAGVSMGAGAAYHHAFKNSEKAKVILGIYPPLNTRWIDCHGRYQGNFDPNCWGWRTDYRRKLEVVARFQLIFTVRLGQITRPLYGKDKDIADLVAQGNPIEMLDFYDIKPGQFSMFAAYGGKDQFNIDAQVESFLFVAKEKGIEVEVAYDPRGRHDKPTALKFIPIAIDWLALQLEPFAPK